MKYLGPGSGQTPTSAMIVPSGITLVLSGLTISQPVGLASSEYPRGHTRSRGPLRILSGDEGFTTNPLIRRSAPISTLSPTSPTPPQARPPEKYEGAYVGSATAASDVGLAVLADGDGKAVAAAPAVGFAGVECAAGFEPAQAAVIIGSTRTATSRGFHMAPFPLHSVLALCARSAMVRGGRTGDIGVPLVPTPGKAGEFPQPRCAGGSSRVPGTECLMLSESLFRPLNTNDLPRPRGKSGRRAPWLTLCLVRGRISTAGVCGRLPRPAICQEPRKRHARSDHPRHHHLLRRSRVR